MGTVTQPSEQLTQAAREVARLQGRAPELFSVGTMPNGSIWVRGPGAIAFYPPDSWLSKFARHLELGVYEHGSPARKQ